MLKRLSPLLTLLLPLGILAAFAYLGIRIRSQRAKAEADPNIRVEALTDDTVIDKNGAVRSVQGGDVWLPSDQLDALWTAENLERLARTYWYHLGRVSFRLLRVMYTPNGRAWRSSAWCP